jgi:peroxiredoxin
MREYKRLQMALVGGEVPILRCHLHPRVLNVGFDGKIYESGTDWEERFKDVVHLDELESANTIVTRVIGQVRKEMAEGERFKLELQDAQRAARAGRMDDFENHFHTLQRDFPDRPEIYGIVLSAAMDREPEQARKLAQDVLNAKTAPESAKEFAEGLVRKADAVGKPLDLSFTALDGRQMALSQMKGKVILIDFWATWCAPCVAELPNVKAAYDRLHSRGFEVVGISFDNSRDALTKFIAEKGLAWPQYFDGKGWQNQLGRQYGIHGIPTMWLVDKKGVLRDLKANGLLEEKVEQLLEEGSGNSTLPDASGSSH